jgi:hypothetical protein
MPSPLLRTYRTYFLIINSLRRREGMARPVVFLIRERSASILSFSENPGSFELFAFAMELVAVVAEKSGIRTFFKLAAEGALENCSQPHQVFTHAYTCFQTPRIFRTRGVSS